MLQRHLVLAFYLQLLLGLQVRDNVDCFYRHFKINEIWFYLEIEPPPFIPSFTVRFDPISFHQLELLLESKGLSNYTSKILSHLFFKPDVA
jgi:hypothetical protein